MGLLSTLRAAFTSRRSAVATTPAEWLGDWYGARMTSAGERIGPAQALGHCPVWQATNIIAGDLGQLPFRVMKRTGERCAEVTGHPVEWVLNHEPNEVQTPSVFKETLMTWALLWGNGCAWIDRDELGRVRSLIPLAPWRLRVTQDPEATHGFGYMLVYSTLEGRQIGLLPSDVIHIRGLATDGVWGRSAIDVACEVLGLGIAAREHAANTLRNGGRPSGVLETGYESIDDAARTKLRAEWLKVHGGPRGAHTPAILPNLMKYVPIGMSNTDAQLLELMRLDREQVASLFNLPAFKLNALENAAVRANVSESNREYYATTLSRWAMRFSEELGHKLFAPSERRRYSIKVDAEALTAGSPDDRMRRAVLGVRGKLLTRNEGRELVGLNPVPGGDQFENPATSVGAGDSIPAE